MRTRTRVIGLLAIFLIAMSVNSIQAYADLHKTGEPCRYNMWGLVKVCEVDSSGGPTGSYCKCKKSGIGSLLPGLTKGTWQCGISCPSGEMCIDSSCKAYTNKDLKCDPKVSARAFCINDKTYCTCVSGFGSTGKRYNYVCSPCKEGNICDKATDQCKATPVPTPAGARVTGCSPTNFILEGKDSAGKNIGMCRETCTCTGTTLIDQCIRLVQIDKPTAASVKMISFNSKEALVQVDRSNVPETECTAKPAGPSTGGGGQPGAVTGSPERHAQCKTEVGSDYSCLDITSIKKEDYDCQIKKCNYGTDATNPNVQCCRPKTEEEKATESSKLTAEQQAEYDKKIQEIANKIAEETCKPALEKSMDEWKAAVTKAKSQCEAVKILLPQAFLPLASQMAADCKKAIDSICLNVKVTDKKTTKLNDCKEYCPDPDGCTCYIDGKYQCEVGEGDKKQIIRYQPGENIANIQMGSNCLGASTGICSGSNRDGICPRQCFFINDIDCRSQKTTGYLLGDIAMRFMNKQKWYTDFMEWIGSWSKWIDPKQWMKSWCNPANRKQGIMDSVGVYSDDGELYAWYGGEMAVYNYTKDNRVSRYLYTVTWGIGNLQQNASYKITLAREFGGQTVRAFPANAEWFNIKAGESHQGRETAKAFFLKDVYSYVCMEFSNKFQGSTRHCRQISEEGEYRATGDPAIVTEEGYTTATGSSTKPGSDSGVNCQLSGSC